VRAAKEEIERNAIDAAILDINLGDQTSFPIADELAERSIPFLFASGYGEQARLPDQFADIPVLRKPYAAGMIAEELSRLI